MRRPASGQTARSRSRPTKDFLPHIRCFGQRRDAVTGADVVFAGDPSGIFRGAIDTASGSLRWDAIPELAVAELNIPPAPGIGDRLRVGAFAEANGVLYVSVGQQIYQRVDGRTPSWRLLYAHSQQHVTETGLRGMTAVATPTGREMLLAVAEGYQSRIVRIDPADGSEMTDLDLDAFLNRAWGTRVSFVIAAYNDMAPIGDALLLGLEAFIPPRSPRPPGHTVLDVVHGLEGGAWYLIRDRAGQYRLRQIEVDFPHMGRSLVSVRAILASPFPGDRAVYLAGYDANYTPIHNSAWITRATTAVALAEWSRACLGVRPSHRRLIGQSAWLAGFVYCYQHEFGSRYAGAVALAATQDPGLDGQRDRGAAGADDVGIDAHDVADLHRLQEAQVGDCGGGDTSLGVCAGGDASGEVHQRHDPATEDVAGGIGVGGHRHRSEREFAGRLGHGIRHRAVSC